MTLAVLVSSSLLSAVARTPSAADTREPISTTEPRQINRSLPAPAMTAEPRALDRSEPVCQDQLVQLLYRTGWRGTQLRMAYAIAWRESNGKAGVIGNGGYGLFQLQASAHSNKPWWDWHRMLEAGYNARAAYLLWKENGWRPWGLDKEGNLDPTEYRSWSPAQQQQWIVEPFHKYLNQYDKHCEE